MESQRTFNVTNLNEAVRTGEAKKIRRRQNIKMELHFGGAEGDLRLGHDH